MMNNVSTKIVRDIFFSSRVLIEIGSEVKRCVDLYSLETFHDAGNLLAILAGGELLDHLKQIVQPLLWNAVDDRLDAFFGAHVRALIVGSILFYLIRKAHCS